MVLSSKKIEFEVVDITSSTDVKDKMRKIVGDPKALPPQICNGDQYCGVNMFLWVAPPQLVFATVVVSLNIFNSIQFILNS